VSNGEDGARSLRTPLVVVGGAAVAFLVVAVVLGVLALHWHGKATEASADGSSGAGDAAVKVASRGLAEIATFDYRTYGTSVPWAKDFTSAASAKPFIENHNALTKAIKQTKTTSKASVGETMSHVVGADEVDVYAAINSDRTFVDAHGKEQRAHETQRFLVTMKQVAGAWKIDAITLLNPPSQAGGA